MALGNPDGESIFTGKESQSPYAATIFITSSFVILIHLLNMLIAIMCDTFIKNQEVEEQLLLKGKLKFIVDNWYMNKIALGKDKKRIKFIITALISETIKDEEEKNFKEL